MTHRRLLRALQNGLGWLLVLPLLYPFVWLVLGALWPDNRPLSDWLTAEWGFRLSVGNFAAVAQTIPLGRFVLNSLRVVALALPVSLLVASWAGFASARLSAPARRWFVWISLAALLAPPTALWLARFPFYRLLGWLDTPLALIAPALLGGSPFFVLLLHSAYLRLSPELLEAAALDGASLWQSWRRVALPNVAGTTAGVAVLNFLYFWNNFTDPLLYIRSTGQMTLPVGVQLLAQMDPSRWPLLLAGSVLLALPPVLVFAGAQRLLRGVAVTLR